LTDIVERLRALVIIDEVRSDNQLGKEAADEIVRLRAEVERLVKSRNKWGKRYNDTLVKLKAAVWTDTEQVKALNEATIKLAAERDACVREVSSLGQQLGAVQAERDRLRDALQPFARPEFAGFQCGMKMWLLTTSQGEVCTTPIWSGDFDKAIAALKGDTR